jgi:hypothetical protein
MSRVAAAAALGIRDTAFDANIVILMFEKRIKKP